VLSTARHLLGQLGLDPTALATLGRPAPAIPTFTDYLPRVRAAASPATLHTYNSYWNHIQRRWGARRLDEITATDVEALLRTLIAGAVRRRNHRAGRNTGENFTCAARALYNRAIADGLIDPPPARPTGRETPPATLHPPRPHRPRTRADLRRHPHQRQRRHPRHTATAPACGDHRPPRGGILGLCLANLDTELCVLLLREKGGTLRWQPISPSLTRALADHAACRGTLLPTDTLLRYHDGQPPTYRRYDHLWHRLGQNLPWVATQGRSTHWLRHTTLTWVERHFGYGIARAYAGHTDSTGPATTTYIKASVQDVATAWPH
jgi:hypothetical protein